jgi:hypothetical protein
MNTYIYTQTTYIQVSIQQTKAWLLYSGDVSTSYRYTVPRDATVAQIFEIVDIRSAIVRRRDQARLHAYVDGGLRDEKALVGGLELLTLRIQSSENRNLAGSRVIESAVNFSKFTVDIVNRRDMHVHDPTRNRLVFDSAVGRLHIVTDVPAPISTLRRTNSDNIFPANNASVPASNIEDTQGGPTSNKRNAIMANLHLHLSGFALEIDCHCAENVSVFQSMWVQNNHNNDQGKNNSNHNQGERQQYDYHDRDAYTRGKGHAQETSAAGAAHTLDTSSHSSMHGLPTLNRHHGARTSSSYKEAPGGQNNRTTGVLYNQGGGKAHQSGGNDAYTGRRVNEYGGQVGHADAYDSNMVRSHGDVGRMNAYDDDDDEPAINAFNHAIVDKKHVRAGQNHDTGLNLGSDRNSVLKNIGPGNERKAVSRDRQLKWGESASYMPAESRHHGESIHEDLDDEDGMARYFGDTPQDRGDMAGENDAPKQSGARLVVFEMTTTLREGKCVIVPKGSAQDVNFGGNHFGGSSTVKRREIVIPIPQCSVVAEVCCCVCVYV